ncbi:MAG: hypothetical protein GY772_02050 [bacterium]|nr:hypothetical protein [bacterium]
MDSDPELPESADSAEAEADRACAGSATPAMPWAGLVGFPRRERLLGSTTVNPCVSPPSPVA